METCRKCGSNLIPTSTQYGTLHECPKCQTAIKLARAARPRQRALKLPGLEPGRQSVLVKELEEPIFQRVVACLSREGYEVDTTVRRRKMQHCTCGKSFWQQGGDGVSMRIGDMTVGIPRERPCSLILLDTKSTKGHGRPGQIEMEGLGLLYFVKSEDEALAAVREAERRMVERCLEIAATERAELEKWAQIISEATE